MEGSEGGNQDTLQSVKRGLQICQTRLDKLTHIVKALLKMQAERCFSAEEKYTGLWAGMSEVWDASSIQPNNRVDEFGLPTHA